MTFKEGLYVIKDGKLLTKGGGTYRGNGVSFYLTGVDTGISFTGGGVFDLKAMTSGPLKSFLFFLDPNAVPEKRSVIGGGGDVKYEGIFYFPIQDIEVTGGSDTADPSPWTMYIAKTILYGGGGTMRLRHEPDKGTVPLPDELKPLGTNVRLVK